MNLRDAAGVKPRFWVLLCERDCKVSDYNWISEDVFTVNEFLTGEECALYIELSELLGYDDAPIETAFGPQRRPDVRNNQRAMRDDPERAKGLWKRIRDYVPLRRGD